MICRGAESPIDTSSQQSVISIQHELLSDDLSAELFHSFEILAGFDRNRLKAG